MVVGLLLYGHALSGHQLVVIVRIVETLFLRLGSLDHELGPSAAKVIRLVGWCFHLVVVFVIFVFGHVSEDLTRLKILRTLFKF